MCLEGASRAGTELLAALPHPNLRLHYVWAPVLPPDDRATAAANAQRLADARATHYWDGEQALARAMGESLAISARESVPVDGGHGLAWDVYLAYGRGALDLSRPALWMHQLGVKHAPRLDPAVFRQRVEELLEETSPPSEGQA